MNQPRASSFGCGRLFFKRIDGVIGQWINRIYDSLPDHSPYFAYLCNRERTDPHMDNCRWKSRQAEYISSSADRVTIRIKGKEYTLPFSRFSKADQEYVKEGLWTIFVRRPSTL